MRTKQAAVIIAKKNGEKLAIFDTSETIFYRWVMASSRVWGELETFLSTREMLKFVAEQQSEGAQITTGADFLKQEASNEGCDSWEEYVKENFE